VTMSGRTEVAFSIRELVRLEDLLVAVLLRLGTKGRADNRLRGDTRRALEVVGLVLQEVRMGRCSSME